MKVKNLTRTWSTRKRFHWLLSLPDSRLNREPSALSQGGGAKFLEKRVGFINHIPHINFMFENEAVSQNTCNLFVQYLRGSVASSKNTNLQDIDFNTLFSGTLMPPFTDRITPSEASYLPLNLHTMPEVAGFLLPFLAVLTC